LLLSLIPVSLSLSLSLFSRVALSLSLSVLVETLARTAKREREKKKAKQQAQKATKAMRSIIAGGSSGGLLRRLAVSSSSTRAPPPPLASAPTAAPLPGRRAVSSAAASGSSANFPGRSVKVSHILVPADRAAELDAVELQLSAGETMFEAAAREKSTCPSSASGGKLGWLGRGDTVPAFEAAAFSTPVGGLARASTDFGEHLLAVEEEKKGKIEVAQMGVTELRDLLEEIKAAGGNGEKVQLIDVREENEFETARIEGFALKPLSRLMEWGSFANKDMDPEAWTVVLCHHGMRSMQVSNFLVQQAGFGRVFNVSGGIDAYSRLVDPTVPRY